MARVQQNVQIEVRLASLETKMKAIFWVAGILTPIMFGAAYWIESNIVAMKQALADGGIGRLVVSIEKPSSPQQLKANLQLVASQIRVARLGGEKPNLARIKAISRAVEGVASTNPDLPEVWQAASQLISYRSVVGSSSEQLPDCLDSQVTGGTIVSPPDGTTTVLQPIVLHNCRMVMDFNLEDLKRKKGNIPLYPFFDLPYGRWKNGPAIIFDNAVIEYRGGPIRVKVPMAFQNCTFDFDLQQVPSRNGSLLVRTLLASDEQNVMVPFSAFDQENPNG
jgi:hypothetical protein